MRSGRNYINVLSSNIVIACGVDKGTISEISLSLVNTAKKKVIIVGAIEEVNKLFKRIDSENVYIAKNYKECIKIFEQLDI